MLGRRVAGGQIDQPRVRLFAVARGEVVGDADQSSVRTREHAACAIDQRVAHADLGRKPPASFATAVAAAWAAGSMLRRRWLAVSSRGGQQSR